MARVHPMFYVLLAIFGVLSLMVIWPLWAFALGGLLLGYFGQPIYRPINQRLKRPELSASIALVIILVVLLIPLGFLGYQLVVETRDIAQSVTAEDARSYLESTANTTRSLFGWPPEHENRTATEAIIDESVPTLRTAVLDWLPSAATFALEFIGGLVVALFIGFYALKDGDRFVLFIEEALPLRPTTEKRMIREVERTLDAVIFGQVLTAAAQGIMGGIGFWLFGIPAPVFWGFIMAVLSFLPIVGAPMVWVPAVLFLFLTGHTTAGILLLAWSFAFIWTIDHVVKPKVMSARSGMHPTLALLGVLGGLVAFGFMGFILGPLFLSLFVLLLNVHIEDRRARMLEAPPIPEQDP